MMLTIDIVTMAGEERPEIMLSDRYIVFFHRVHKSTGLINIP